MRNVDKILKDFFTQNEIEYKGVVDGTIILAPMDNFELKFGDYAYTDSDDEGFTWLKETNAKGLYLYGREAFHNSGIIYPVEVGEVNKMFDLTLIPIDFVYDDKTVWSRCLAMDAHNLRHLIESQKDTKLNIVEFWNEKEKIYKLEGVE